MQLLLNINFYLKKSLPTTHHKEQIMTFKKLTKKIEVCMWQQQHPI
jgi:hypothetical protein